MGRDPSGEIADLRTALARVADQIGIVEGSLESLQGEISRLDGTIETSIAGQEGWRRDIASVEARLSAVRGEVDDLRERPTGDGEAVARLEAEGERAREEIGRQRGELEALRRQDDDLARRAAEIDRRSLALESRLGSIEEGQLRQVENSTRLETMSRELERIAGNSEPLGELDRSVRQLVEEHASTRRLVDAQEEHRGSLEASLAKLEAGRIEVARVVESLQHRAEAGKLEALEDRETIRDGLHRVVEDQDDLQGRLKAAELEQGLLQDELNRFRIEMDALRAEALARSERDRAEISALRDEIAARLKPAGPADIAGASAPDPVGRQAPPARLVMGAAKGSAFDIDQFALDLLDLVPTSRASGAGMAPQPPVQPAANPLESEAGPEQGSSEKDAEMDQACRQFNRSMAEGKLAQAVASARKMVDLSRDRFGVRNTKHALWLRNLGFCLTRMGVLAEARALLISALEITQGDLPANPVPHAICLIDLGDLHVFEGDPPQARASFQKALAVLKASGMAPDDPILQRAQENLNRIAARPATSPGFATVSITT